MIKLTSTGVSNRTRNWYLCRRGCIVGVDVLITPPMVLLGDEAQVEACLGPFRDSANLDIG